MFNNLTVSMVPLVGAAFLSFAASLMLAEEASAIETCYAGNTISNPPADPSGSPINFPGTSFDSLTGWRTYSTIAQQFKTSADVTVTSIKLKNLSVTGAPGDVLLALTRMSGPFPPYQTPVPLSVPAEGQALITESGPADAWVTFHLNVPVSLTADTFYGVMLRVDWPDNPPVPPDAPDDYWSVQRGFNDPYTTNRIVYLTDTGWATMSDDGSDLFFEVCLETDVTYQTVNPVTGGEATLVADEGTLDTVTPIAVPNDNTPNADFPFGMFDLSITGLAVGATTTVTLTFDENVAVGTKWWKYLGGGSWISLDIGSDNGDNVITVDLQDGGPEDSDPTPGVIGDPGGPGLQHPIDLDIAAFRVAKRARIGGKDIGIKLVAKNYGAYDYEPRTATVVGMQDGSEVYNEFLDVEDAVGGGASRYSFPSYMPTSTGDITWTVTIDDDDPDVDTATAVTQVK